MIKALFTPVKIGGIELRNRIVFPPIMGPGFATADGRVSERRIAFHQSQANGGVGLIITGGVVVDPFGAYTSAHIGLWDDRFIPDLQRLASAVHTHGAKLAPQIMDQGARRNATITGRQPLAPSPVRAKETWLQTVPHELTEEEIGMLIESFGEGARRARDAGCDAVELHAAHGRHNLVSQFLSSLCNKRTDAYGGSLAGRLRFPIEILKRMKQRAGHDFPIIVRISGEEKVAGGRTLLETEMAVAMLARAGADAIHVSGGSYPDTPWWIIPPAGMPPGLNVYASEALMKVSHLPIIVAGGIRNVILADHIVSTNKADMVSMGRALMADPNLPIKAERGELDDIAPCIGCNLGCVGGALKPEGMTCLVNPTAGREGEVRVDPAAESRRILVAGGGAAGLEAARVAALRGHHVTLSEKTDKLGGQFNLAAVPPLAQDNALLVKYLTHQVEKLGVDVKTNCEVTPETIEEMRPDVVIVATGGIPLVRIGIRGIERECVVTAHDLLAGKLTTMARNIVIVGGGMVGCEVADWLGEGDENSAVGPVSVTILEKLSNIAPDMLVEPRGVLLESLHRKAVRWIASAEVTEITDDAVVFLKDGGTHSIGGVDLVVLAVGTRPADNLSETIRGRVSEVYVVGDARLPRNALEAIAEANAIGRAL